MTPHSQDYTGPIHRGQPLREAVYQRIVSLVSSGDYPPGAALTEASLSRVLEVSRTPVREALLRLEAEGLLQSALARGFTVRPLDAKEAQELYPILASLEALAVKTANEIDEPALASLRRTLDELIGCRDPVRCWQLDSHWHDLLVDTSGNHKLVEVTRSLRTSLSRYELTYMREVVSRDEADNQHEAILEALTAGNPNQAADLIESHWRDGQHIVLQWLSQ